MKLGFIDNYLSEWHANNYPDLIRNDPVAKANGIDVCYAWAREDVSPVDGVTTDEWCRKFGVERVGSIEELVEKSDGIVVLSPDHPQYHYELAEAALRSGKPTYIDKTFETSRAGAEKLFALAAQYGTPMYSSSALRFADELLPYREAKIPPRSCVVVGPGRMENYAIHLFEIMCCVMKAGARRIMATQATEGRNLVVDYGEGRTAEFVQLHGSNHPSVKFQFHAEGTDGVAEYHEIKSDYFANFVHSMVGFFVDRKPVVPSGETIDLMGLLEKANEALNHPFEWFEI